MTMNSIEYITKKHFRSVTSLLVTLVCLAIAAISVYLTVNAFSPAAAVFSVFTVVSALFSVIRIISPGTGSKLLRLSVGLTALLLFFAAMGMFTLGYLLLRNGGTQNRLNELLAGTEWTIATEPATTGALMYAGSVILYFASGCAFFCHRYLGAVKSCSAGKLKRSGLRVFPALSLIFFLLAAGGIALFIRFSNGVTDEIRSHPHLLLTAILGGLILLHPLFAGICARSYAKKTFPFKVFERQIMKVETNADGTVYVPINEDHEPDEEEPVPSPKVRGTKEEHRKGKPFISEIPPAPLPDENKGSRHSGEEDIL